NPSVDFLSRLPSVPADKPDKQHAEDDAKNVHVNLTANNSALDLGKGADALQTEASQAIEEVKEETKSSFSTVVETGKSYFRSLFPETAVEEAASPHLSPALPQPTISQRPILERPGYHVQSSTQKILQQSKDVHADIDLPIKKAQASEATMMKAIY